MKLLPKIYLTDTKDNRLIQKIIYLRQVNELLSNIQLQLFTSHADKIQIKHQSLENVNVAIKKAALEITQELENLHLTKKQFSAIQKIEMNLSFGRDEMVQKNIEDIADMFIK